MAPLRAQMRNGKLVIDEPPTDLPEGQVVYLTLVGDGLDLDPEEEAELDRHLDQAFAEAKRGEVYDADEVLAELDAES